LILAFVFAVGGSFTPTINSDKMVLRMANARPVAKEKEPYLYHTIEGVAIAAGYQLQKLMLLNLMFLMPSLTGGTLKMLQLQLPGGLWI
jgi:hypothetical protein